MKTHVFAFVPPCLTSWGSDGDGAFNHLTCNFGEYLYSIFREQMVDENTLLEERHLLSKEH